MTRALLQILIGERKLLTLISWVPVELISEPFGVSEEEARSA